MTDLSRLELRHEPNPMRWNTFVPVRPVTMAHLSGAVRPLDHVVVRFTASGAQTRVRLICDGRCGLVGEGGARDHSDHTRSVELASFPRDVRDAVLNAVNVAVVNTGERIIWGN